LQRLEAIVRIRSIAVAAVLALAAPTLGVGHPAGGEADTAKLGCKLTGVRYVGAGAGRAAVCFTLTANVKTMREYAFDGCAASDVGLGRSRFAKRVPIRATGTFSATSSTAAVSDGAYSFVNVTFRGRIQGNRASGTLLLAGFGTTFRCTWAARRAAG